MNRLQRTHLPSANNVIDRVYGVLRDIKRQDECGILDVGSAHRELEEALLNLSRLEGDASIPSESLKKTLQSVRGFKEHLHQNHDQDAPNTTSDRSDDQRYDQTQHNQHGKGRNEFVIDIAKLRHLISLGFSVKQIAKDGLLGGVLHPNTLYKKLKENNISVRSSYTDISDAELDTLVSEYNHDHKNSGWSEIQAYLKTRGINVKRDRCRAALSRVDSLGTAVRWSSTIQRRQYRVPTANSLWHVDTHHSLKRWGIVVHGGIDGHSRLIPFLRASTRNTSKAAACFFIQALRTFGVPSRVRADHGTEYVGIGSLMLAVNGEDRGSFLTGPSVHNQRIERLWRDVFAKVLDTYYKLFCYMEERKDFDPDNCRHIWVLQYVFTKRIDVALKDWMAIHNNHKIRTEGSKTPNMLWLQSVVQGDVSKNRGIRNVYSPPLENLSQAITTLGLEEEDTLFLQPRESCPLSAVDLDLLGASVDVLRPSTSHGLDVYGDVIEFVNSRGGSQS